MIIIATLATIIASQALITGSFSLTRQAIHMSLLPRMKIIQTSFGEIGTDLHTGCELPADGHNDHHRAFFPEFGRSRFCLRHRCFWHNVDHNGASLSRDGWIVGTGSRRWRCQLSPFSGSLTWASSLVIR